MHLATRRPRDWPTEEATTALTAEPSGINSPAALAVTDARSLWLGDPARARAALRRDAGFRGRWMAATRLTATAGIAVLEGAGRRGGSAYARALEAWRTLDSPLDLALCALDRAVLRGPDPARGGEDDEAREIFSRIGATPFLARLDQSRRGPQGRLTHRDEPERGMNRKAKG